MKESEAVAKLAANPDRYIRRVLHFPSARAAFAAYLRKERIGRDETVLLPAYIGWSSREGSGVFDPVLAAGCKSAFYRVTPQLQIDRDHFCRQLEEHHPRVVVIIHYFGYPDPHLAELAQLARLGGASVLEDEAHAMLSDWIGGICGRFGDACIFSLHKLLPVSSGGLLIINGSDISNDALALTSNEVSTVQLLSYDLAAIASVRRRNAVFLADALKPLAGRVDLLFNTLPPGVVPQTLPVLIRSRSRDELYFEMNAAGFGVVSLYHTLVDAVTPDAFPDSHDLAHHIMNLPVHQDVETDQLEMVVAQLDRLTGKTR